jgi:hypothetical protein
MVFQISLRQIGFGFFLCREEGYPRNICSDCYYNILGLEVIKIEATDVCIAFHA